MKVKEFNQKVEEIFKKNNWESWVVYSSFLKNGNRSSRYSRNGWKVPQESKDGIVKDLLEMEEVISAKWYVVDTFRGDMDSIKVVSTIQ